jgi:predicted DCC family thiol-disulfide oxidoreductase YuxK
MNVQQPSSARHLIIFDGTCILCHRLLRYVLTNDTNNEWVASPNTTTYSKSMISKCDGTIPSPNETVVVIRDINTNPRLLTHSSAGLFCLTHSSPIGKLSYVGYLCPRIIRDMIYRFIACRRYRWFGQCKYCSQIPQNLKNKIIM